MSVTPKPTTIEEFVEAFEAVVREAAPHYDHINGSVFFPYYQDPVMTANLPEEERAALKDGKACLIGMTYHYLWKTRPSFQQHPHAVSVDTDHAIQAIIQELDGATPLEAQWLLQRGVYLNDEFIVTNPESTEPWYSKEGRYRSIDEILTTLAEDSKHVDKIHHDRHIYGDDPFDEAEAEEEYHPNDAD